MTYDECERLNRLTRPARERAWRRERQRRMAIQWGGWLVAGLILMAEFAVRVS